MNTCKNITLAHLITHNHANARGVYYEIASHIVFKVKKKKLSAIQKNTCHATALIFC